MKSLTGVVFSTNMQSSASVSIETRWQHPTYKKIVKRTKKFTSDNALGAKPGDVVTIVETRPLSKTKRWRITNIVKPAQTTTKKTKSKS